MSEKNQVRTLMDRVQKTLSEGKAQEALKDLDALEELGSDDPRAKLYRAMGLAALGRKDEAKMLAQYARTASQNLSTEADALLQRLS